LNKPEEMEEDTRLPNEAELEEFRTVIGLYNNFREKKRQEEIAKIKADRENLPIAAYRQQILDAVSNMHQSALIIAGDTGCGVSHPFFFFIIFFLLDFRHSNKKKKNHNNPWPKFNMNDLRNRLKWFNICLKQDTNTLLALNPGGLRVCHSAEEFRMNR
jgi:hypothetical protein